MKIIGITGGAGSGKSEIGKIIEKQYNTHLIIADQVAHKLMEQGNISYDLITDYFGKEILNDDGQIDRKRLSEIVFNNKEKLTILNSFVHPYVKSEIINQINKLKEVGTIDFVIIEAALLIEDGYQNICDELWYVYADEDIKRTRLKKQRAYSDEKIDIVFKNQLSDEEFRRNCVKIIDNNENIEKTINNIKKLFE